MKVSALICYLLNEACFLIIILNPLMPTWLHVTAIACGALALVGIIGLILTARM